jgi:hypothetical protein
MEEKPIWRIELGIRVAVFEGDICRDCMCPDYEPTYYKQLSSPLAEAEDFAPGSPGLSYGSQRSDLNTRLRKKGIKPVGLF